jgi:uncharacterized membrane protein YbaN (DUF454 family)
MGTHHTPKRLDTNRNRPSMLVRMQQNVINSSSAQRQEQNLYLWIAIGLFFLLLGGIGVFLPLLPTTPFVLLAAACFARSSPRLHAWVLRSELFGPMLRDWERNKCVSRKVKLLALFMMAAVGGVSILLYVPAGWPSLAGAGLVSLGCLTVLNLKTCPFQET